MLDILIKAARSSMARREALCGGRGDLRRRIVSIGRISDSARRIIKADGLIVAPGFIDGHTHMDAQVMWDPLGTCSCYHGVTSVVMKNCGFTLAPCKPATATGTSCLSYVETSLRPPWPPAWSGLGRRFRSTWHRRAAAKGPQLRDVRRHSALRMYVMAVVRYDEATDEDIRAYYATRGGVRAAPWAFRLSRSHTHLTPEGTPVASRQAAWNEVEASCRHDGTRHGHIPDRQESSLYKENVASSRA